MTEPFSTVCERCSATLKLKNHDLIGKKAKCPKCGESFVVTEAASPQKKPVIKKKKVDDSEGFMDVDPNDYESPPEEEVDDEEEDRPAGRKRTSSSGKKKSKKSKSKGNSGQVFTIIAIVVVVIGVLGGGGYGLMALAKNGSSDLDWLPTEIEGYTKIQVDDLWRSGVLQPLVTGDAGKKFVEEMTKHMGMGPQDIDSVIIGFPKSAGPFSQIVVVRSKLPFDLSKLQSSASEKVESVSHAGSQYQKDGSIAIFLADNKTLVRGTEAIVKDVMTRGKRNPSASNFGFARGCRDHVVVAVYSPGTASSSFGAGSMMGLGNSHCQRENLLFRANATSDINGSFVANFKNAETAKGVVEKTQADLAKGKTQMGQQKAQLQSLPPNPMVKVEDLKKMIDSMEQVMNSITVSQWGSQMKVKMSVSGQLIKDVTEMAKSSPFPSPAGRFPSLFGN